MLIAVYVPTVTSLWVTSPLPSQSESASHGHQVYATFCANVATSCCQLRCGMISVLDSENLLTLLCLCLPPKYFWVPIQTFSHVLTNATTAE
mmetsp:Transcript_97263/g.167623  ORF Transcript_97263/g.167623 Transcript_97263/m.167623 type:complete len:92 (-) Transcript_97263:751-1026(-)